MITRRVLFNEPKVEKRDGFVIDYEYSICEREETVEKGVLTLIILRRAPEKWGIPKDYLAGENDLWRLSRIGLQYIMLELEGQVKSGFTFSHSVKIEFLSEPEHLYLSSEDLAKVPLEYEVEVFQFEG